MAIYEITLEDGSIFEIETADENQGQPQQQGMLGKAWDVLSVPEKKSREGLGMLSDMVPKHEPTGDLMTDIKYGSPRLAAETIAEAAPSFVSPMSLALGGALGGAKLASKVPGVVPAVKAVGGKIAKAAEGISGLEYKNPDVLKDAAKDSTLFFEKGTNSIAPLFKELVSKGRIRKSFAEATDSKSLIDDAIKAADDGSLTPEEGLIARQTLDGIKRSMPKYSFNQLRDRFDSVAKTVTKEVDAAFRRAVKADALRTVFATNKSGGTSIAKGILGSLAGVLPSIAMSPMAQGATATAVGAGARAAGRLADKAIPVGSSVGAALSQMNRKRKK